MALIGLSSTSSTRAPEPAATRARSSSCDVEAGGLVVWSRTATSRVATDWRLSGLIR